MKISKTSRHLITGSIFFLVGLFVAFSYIEPSFVTASSTAANSISLQPPAASKGPGVPAALNMGMPAGVPITTLQAPQTATHMKQFRLTAEPTLIKLRTGVIIHGWGYNGMVPGPTLHVQQGDLVEVTLVNHLSFGVTIHWHGVRVPNSSDGVAGLTQNAVKPGQSYIYRFVALDPGTYWYHSHEFSYSETGGGLYGMLIVDPATPTFHADVDVSVTLHEWNGLDNQQVLAINDTTQVLSEQAHPGQWVRLRIVNTSETSSGVPQLVTLVGAPFKVIALDGHDLNGPQELTATPLPIGTAQRYDLLFLMPASGVVALVTSQDNQSYQSTPRVQIGQGSSPAKLPLVSSKWFDPTSYGLPDNDALTLQTNYDTTYTITLNNQPGTSLGRMGMTYTLNGKVFPDTGMIMVHPGQIIRLRFVNQSNLYHPMHLHGHIFTILARNGQPLTGSPVHLDTVLVPPHETYDAAFVADNPGIWMLHCHNFLHANWGMDMMIEYYNYTTPYTMGSDTNNFPD